MKEIAMRRVVCALSIIAWSSAAIAEPARYLTGPEILGSFTGHTMLWEDYRIPEKVPAIVHYAAGSEIDILYDGHLVSNRFTFDYDGKAICWVRQTTTCRSFLYDGGAHVFVVDPETPDEKLAEVTRVTSDNDSAIFDKIVTAEVAPPAPAPQSRAGSNPRMSAGDLALMVIVGAMLVESFSGGDGSSEPRGANGMTANETTAYWNNKRHEQ